MTAIKFCGFTRAEDVRMAATLGVDYVGLILADGSPRRLDLDQAANLAGIARSMPRPPKIVALVRNATAAFVRTVVSTLAPDRLQFHGNEPEPFCTAFGVAYWKAVGVEANADVADAICRYPSADAVLLDAHEPGGAGGTGHVFDWHRWPRIDRRLILAGGLTPGNVADAIRLTHPFAVDVASGIESAPGIKSPALMRAFIEAVRAAA